MRQDLIAKLLRWTRHKTQISIVESTFKPQDLAQHFQAAPPATAVALLVPQAALPLARGMCPPADASAKVVLNLHIPHGLESLTGVPKALFVFLISK